MEGRLWVQSLMVSINKTKKTLFIINSIDLDSFLDLYSDMISIELKISFSIDLYIYSKTVGSIIYRRNLS